jgi:hypothetical protein
VARPSRGGVRNVKIVDTDHGFKRLLGALGEMGAVTIGVQGDDVNKIHDADNPRKNKRTIGYLAAKHELGLGITKRSFIVDWIDENAAMVQKDAARELRFVLKGKKTRSVALATNGFKWCKSVRDRMASGGVHPPISADTAARKGHDTPLIETYDLHNHVTFKVFLPRASSIKNKRQRAIVQGKK